MTRSAAVRFAGDGIRINAICPGAVVTGLAAATVGDPGRKSALEQIAPMGRIADPDEIAHAVVFLAADRASFITGHPSPSTEASRAVGRGHDRLAGEKTMGYGARVEAFVEAWNRLDYTAILAAMAPDVRYHNIPMQPLDGIEAVRGFLGSMGARRAEWTIHHMAENGRVVLTERTDRFEIDGTWIAVRVMGTFEFDDQGLIAAWRDYFDLAQFTSQLPR